MGLHFFHASCEGDAGGSAQHVVRKNEAHWLTSQNGEGFRAGTRGEHQVAFSLQNSFAEPEIGFVVLYAKDSGLAGLSTRETLASHPVPHNNSKDTQPGRPKTGQYCSLFHLKVMIRDKPNYGESGLLGCRLSGLVFTDRCVDAGIPQH